MIQFCAQEFFQANLSKRIKIFIKTSNLDKSIHFVWEKSNHKQEYHFSKSIQTQKNQKFRSETESGLSISNSSLTISLYFTKFGLKSKNNTAKNFEFFRNQKTYLVLKIKSFTF